MRKNLWVIWGKVNVARMSVNPREYEKVGKLDKFVLYKKRKSKKKGVRIIDKPNKLRGTRKQKKWTNVEKKIKERRERTEEEKQIIRRIKGESFTTGKGNKVFEEELLKKVSFLPVIPIKKYRKEINPRGNVHFGAKEYGSFNDLANDRSYVYKSVVMNEALKKDSKVWDNIFRLRKKIFRDGFVLKVDLYGSINRGLDRKDYYLGSLDINGILPEDANFMEGELMGATGYLHDVANILDLSVRGRGGRGAVLSSDNTKNIQITVCSVKINYSFA